MCSFSVGYYGAHDHSCLIFVILLIDQPFDLRFERLVQDGDADIGFSARANKSLGSHKFL